MSIIIQLPKDINRFCRTCMNVTEDLKQSFDNHVLQNEQPTELCKILQSVTSLNINPIDGLPETLCPQCSDNLKSAYVFINQCKDVEANLRNLLALSKQPGEKLQGDELESNQYSCQICHETFTSYYNLSRHMINHNGNKNLFERFLENQNEDSKVILNCKLSVNIDMDVLGLIKDRKAYIMKDSSNNEIEDVEEINRKDPVQKKKIKITGVQCKICSKKFTIRKELFTHLCTPNNRGNASQFDNSRSLTCSLCEVIFSDMSSLSLHFVSHALATENIAKASIDSDFFFCEVCGQTLESDSVLQNHYSEKHSGKLTWPCMKCSEIFLKECEQLKHAQVHVNESSETVEEHLSCPLCTNTFISKKALLKHSIEHLMKKYICKKCTLSFCTQHSYFAHLQSHPGYQFTCAICGKFLSTKSALKAHIVGVHSLEQKHKCTICEKCFTTKNRLKVHSEIHTENKKYVCAFCGYSTHKSGDLQMHTRTHTSERPYKCTFSRCTMSFKTSSHLCDHVRRHLQIRRFKCSICAMTFTTNHGLKVHHMQHTGEKPHSCEVCHLKFRRKYHVKVHMKQHQVKLS